MRACMLLLRDLVVADAHGNRLAVFFPAFEVPLVGETCALPWLHLLQSTIIPFQPNTGMILMFLQREMLSILAEMGVLLDEIMHLQTQKSGDLFRFAVF